MLILYVLFLIVFKFSSYLNRDSRIFYIFATFNLKFYVMRLQILVYLNENAFRSGQKLFERVVDADLSVCIPFQSLICDFRYLFGVNCVITFNLM